MFSRGPPRILLGKPVEPTQSKYGKSYTTEKLNAALEAVTEGSSTIYAAAKVFGVPRSTLHDKLRGTHAKPNGRPTILSPEDERSLATYLVYMSERNMPLNGKIAQQFATAIYRRRMRQGAVTGGNYDLEAEACLGKNWWAKFQKRHADELVMRKPDKYDRSRDRACTEEVMMGHFTTLGDFLTKHDLMEQPHKLWNADESGIQMDVESGKVVVYRLNRKSYSIRKGTRDHITVNCCVNAVGAKLTPFIIFAKNYPSESYHASANRDGLWKLRVCKIRKRLH
jgi:hypothetical protein